MVFSEPINPTTFTTSDIMQSGTAMGVTWAISNLGDDQNFILSATASGLGTLMPSIAASVVNDPVGNPNIASMSSDNSVLYDVTPPSVAITSPNGGADWTTNVASQIVSGTCDADVTMTASGVTFTDSDCSDGTWSLDSITLSEGANAITVRGTDPASNFTDEQIVIILDTTVNVAITAPNSGAGFTTNVASQTISGTCDTDATINTSYGTFTDNVCADGNWSLDATLAEGNNTIIVTATDSASNTADDTIVITLDTIAPTVSFTSTPDITLANQYTYTVTGTCSEIGMDVSVNIGGSVAAVPCSGGSFTRTTDISWYSDGMVTMTADQTDAAGNFTQDATSVSKRTQNIASGSTALTMRQALCLISGMSI